jgi:hypothetical protein
MGVCQYRSALLERPTSCLPVIRPESETKRTDDHRRRTAFTRRVWFPQRGSLFQVSGPVGDQGGRFGDGLRKNGIHHEFLAIGRNGVGSADTAHGGGFEQGVRRAQLQAGTVLVNVNSHHLLVRPKEEKFFAVLPPIWSRRPGGRDLPAAGAAGERLNVNLQAASLIVGIGQPFAVGRERGGASTKFVATTGNGFWSPNMGSAQISKLVFDLGSSRR